MAEERILCCIEKYFSWSPDTDKVDVLACKKCQVKCRCMCKCKTHIKFIADNNLKKPDNNLKKPDHKCTDANVDDID